jgi:hypothetical protein
MFGVLHSLRTRDDLSSQEIAEIEKYAIENQKYLDPGYYFDGYVLRNSDGFLV